MQTKESSYQNGKGKCSTYLQHGAAEYAENHLERVAGWMSRWSEEEMEEIFSRVAAVELLIIKFGRVEVVIKMLKKEEGEKALVVLSNGGGWKQKLAVAEFKL